MYNQLLKLINERREQKMIEEKVLKRVSCLKKKKNVWDSSNQHCLKFFCHKEGRSHRKYGEIE